MSETREFTREQIDEITSTSLTQGVILYNDDIKKAITTIMNDSGIEFITKDVLFQILDKKRDEYISVHIANSSGEFNDMLTLPTNSFVPKIDIVEAVTNDSHEHHCCGGHHDENHVCTCGGHCHHEQTGE